MSYPVINIPPSVREYVNRIIEETRKIDALDLSIIRALFIVDAQNGFAPGSNELPVDDAHAIVMVINVLLESDIYKKKGASKDMHPPEALYFADVSGLSQLDRSMIRGILQTIWNRHCVAGTPGADFLPFLRAELLDFIIHKGVEKDLHFFSAFESPELADGSRVTTGLAALLRGLGVTHLDIVGLAFDICVKLTALDAVRLGFKVRVIKAGTRSVFPDQEEAIIRELEDAGVEVIR